MSSNGKAAQVDGLEVGDVISTSGRTITEADLVSFASLTGDWHPQHADASWAAESPFGERIAHGMLVLSYAVGLLPLDPDRVVALRGLRNVVFKRPTRIGDTIRVRSTVAGARPIDGSTALVEMSWKVVDQAGATLVRAQVDVVWRLASGDPEPARTAAADPAEPQPRQVFL